MKNLRFGTIYRIVPEKKEKLKEINPRYFENMNSQRYGYFVPMAIRGANGEIRIRMVDTYQLKVDGCFYEIAKLYASFSNPDIAEQYYHCKAYYYYPGDFLCNPENIDAFEALCDLSEVSEIKRTGSQIFVEADVYFDVWIALGRTATLLKKEAKPDRVRIFKKLLLETVYAGNDLGASLNADRALDNFLKEYPDISNEYRNIVENYEKLKKARQGLQSVYDMYAELANPIMDRLIDFSNKII